ncbi:MAG: hypothetical protein JXM68_08600, partial [Sedimentisphaerales bacterium]|nr:hypothetical protein [Sedimentisphaerales bacterium]
MYNIRLPQAKVKSSQVIVNKWLKSSGVVVANEVICLVQAGQELFEVQSPIDGVIAEIFIPAGSIAFIDEPLAVLGSSEVSANEQGVDQKENEIESRGVMTDKPSVPVSGSENVTTIIMPQAGQSMEEGTVVAWKVAVGDRIEVGQVIFEIETDKAVMEVEAVDAGRIAKIVANEGDIIEVK